ncbi:echinoderm microtubule-associated protein-like CG42247 [Ornithodoros turicata]|uniref:echinoderm microtubule-associated protein-like CG42247 n=1 Tax=Ornithodoros turicata TaxID=34597 RepID=UPI003139FF5A
MEYGSRAPPPRQRRVTNTHSRFLMEAAQRKAMMATFFRNGDPFSSGVKVSINPGRDFRSIENLYDYLSQRLNVSNGVRFIFTTDGKKIGALDELEDGVAYVASGTKAMVPMAYGQLSRGRALQDDPRIIQPVGNRGVLGRRNGWSRTSSQPGSGGRDSTRVITVVNSADSDISSRVLLNLKTEQTFEDVLRDFGDALKMKEVRIMMTPKGEVVRSFSQLKYDLKDVDTFYLEPADDGRTSSLKRHSRSLHSLGSQHAEEEEDKASQTRPDSAKTISRTGSAPSLDDVPLGGSPDVDVRNGFEGNEGDGAGDDEDDEIRKSLEDLLAASIEGNLPVEEPVTSPPPVNGRATSTDDAETDPDPVLDDILGNGSNPTLNSTPGSPVHMERAEPGSQAVSTATSTNRSSPTSNETSSSNSHNARTTPRPDRRPEIIWIHGYKGYGSFNNLHVVQSGDLLYNVASVAVLFSRSKHQQRFYLGHTEDIDCITYDYNGDVAASGQGPGFTGSSRAHIRLWRAETLETIAVLGEDIVSDGVSCLTFSSEGTLLVAVDACPDHELTLWDWKNSALLGRAVACSTPVLGCKFPPGDEELFLTFGVQHLCFWRRGKEGYLDRLDAITSEHAPKTITAVEFLGGVGFVTGDDAGYITVWSSSKEGNYFFISKEYKGHEGDVNVLLHLPHGVLLSACYMEREEQIKAWDSERKYQRIGVASLPKGTGGVHAVCQHLPKAADENIFVGTTHNLIMEGSFKRKFRPVIQSHCREATTVVASPFENVYYTVGKDRAVCKWSITNLVWMTPTESECLSASMHPSGMTLAVGCLDGTLAVFTTETGALIKSITVAASPVSALAYAPDGMTLAVGAEDGSIHLVLVQDHGHTNQKGETIRGRDLIVNLDWSMDNRLLQVITSDGQYQELLCWDTQSLKTKSPTLTRVEWQHLTCTLNPDITGVWDNEHLKGVVNLTCNQSHGKNLIAVGDRGGFLRIFRYPCTSTKDGFTEQKASSAPVSCARFLYSDKYLVTLLGHSGYFIVWKMVSKHPRSSALAT